MLILWDKKNSLQKAIYKKIKDETRLAHHGLENFSAIRPIFVRNE